MRSNKVDDGGQSKAMADRWIKERKEGKEGRIASWLAGPMLLDFSDWTR